MKGTERVNRKVMQFTVDEQCSVSDNVEVPKYMVEQHLSKLFKIFGMSSFLYGNAIESPQIRSIFTN